VLQIKAVKLEPKQFTLKDWDVTIQIKRATLADEGERYTMLFGDNETALVTDIAMSEIYLTLISCDIIGEDEEPLLKLGMEYPAFVEAMTAIWQYDAKLFWAIHESVREVNEHWTPGTEEDAEGNAPTA
jgi:hypothetical protein